MKGLFLLEKTSLDGFFQLKSAKSNKHAFKQNAKKYPYDSIMKKLLLYCVCHDGIGKLSN